MPSIGENGVDEFDERDFSLNYGGLSNVYKDANDDGVDDYPEFNVRNYRYDLRVDWEPILIFHLIYPMVLHGQKHKHNWNCSLSCRRMDI